MKTKYILIFGNVIPASILIVSTLVEFIYPNRLLGLKGTGVTFIYIFAIWLPIVLVDMSNDKTSYPYIKIPTYL